MVDSGETRLMTCISQGVSFFTKHFFFKEQNMHIERKTYNDVLVVPEQRYRCVPNTVRVEGHDLEVVVCNDNSFSVKLSSKISLREGQVVGCGGRRNVSQVSIEGFLTYIDTPMWSGSRPPWCEDLKDIPFGSYQVKISNDGLLALLTKI